MAEYLALDWDDQRLVGLAAQVASKSVQVRAALDFTWSAAENPSEQPEAAGKRLRSELDRAGASTAPVIVSLPREEAVVRLLELPECTDDELPELVRFQAATRSAIPLERLLLDYLPLPPLPGVVGRRVWMVTIGKPVADRIQTVLSAAGLEATAIRLSSMGAAELIAQQAAAAAGPASTTSLPSSTATLIVSCVDLRVEITGVWQNRMVLMHAASLSGHESAEEQIGQILAETSRSTVALAQAAPGLRIGTGWLIGSSTELAPLAKALTERFGVDFRFLENRATTPGLRLDTDSAIADSPPAAAALGLLLGQSGALVDPIDFLHPRRQTAKPDRRKLWIGAGAAAAVLLLLLVYGLIQRRVWQLDTDIADMNAEILAGQKLFDKNAPLRETAASLDEWARRDIDWLDQFHEIATAMGGTEKLHLTTFDSNVSARNALALIVATGRGKSRDDVEEFEDRLHDLGYRVTPKEISEDATDPQFPVKVDLNLELAELHPKPATPAQPAAGAAKPATEGSPSAAKPASSSPRSASPTPAASSAPSSGPTTQPAATTQPAPTTGSSGAQTAPGVAPATTAPGSNVPGSNAPGPSPQTAAPKK